MKRAYSTHGPYRPVAVKRYAEQESTLRAKYRPGQSLTVSKLRYDGTELQTPIRKRYRVAGAYPHHVSCVDEFGIRESFGYFELEDAAVKEART